MTTVARRLISNGVLSSLEKKRKKKQTAPLYNIGKKVASAAVSLLRSHHYGERDNNFERLSLR